jgi:hypothetical protein
MASSHDLTPKALQALRRQGGVLTSTELQELLGVSQPTVSRALAPLIHAGQVQKVGAARSQRYVLPRTVPGVGNEVLVMHIDAQGQPSPFARLVPLEGGAVTLQSKALLRRSGASAQQVSRRRRFFVSFSPSPPQKGSFICPVLTTTANNVLPSVFCSR